MMKAKNLRIWLVFFLLLVCHEVSAHVGDEMLTKLDETLKKSEQYDDMKVAEIEKLRKKAAETIGDRQLYQAYLALYEAYQSYKYDSASVYADKAYKIAHQLQLPDLMVESVSAKVFCLLSAGLYKEAFYELERVDLSHASAPYRYKYYFVKWRLLADISDYCRQEPYSMQYIREAHVLADSLKLLSTNKTEANYIQGMQLMKEKLYEKSEYFFKQVLMDKKLGWHDRAISVSCLGWIYGQRGDRQQALHYLAEAAIYDIMSATKETTALRQVGAILYADGDKDHAIAYVQKALDDANFYDARQRKIEIGNILPIIQQSRYKDLAAQRNVMLLCIILSCAFLAVLALGTLFIHRQMKKIQQAKNLIEDHNRKLEQANRQLSEANKIKTEYIGKSFYVSSEYFDKLEKLYRTIDHKLAAHQYDDLRRMLSAKTLTDERKGMYADFDETFIKLFPNFIDKYNLLFAEADRKTQADKQSLTNEMRIFALIRLGITDSERIAHFLNYSVNTINTYKTRVKNKSMVSNELFEQKIMEI